MTLAWIFGTISLAYLFGSIPFGLLLTKLAGLTDIRTIGSGNIGATNVMRTGHKGLGILTLLLDGGKGAAAVFAVSTVYSRDFAALAGLAAVIGHIFPVWLSFKGGKGVATTIGVFFALDWTLGVAVCGMWLLAFLFMRISSVAAMLSIVYSPIMAYLICGDVNALLCLTLAILIIFTHRSNIARLMQGTEYNFSGRKL